jgi:hypothetical protein
MAYTIGDDILDDEYNGFAGDINTIWGVGSGDSGYGQGTTLSLVSPGNTVTATQWATLIDRMDSIEAHQGSAISNPANPTAGQDIAVISTIPGDITTLNTNRLNAAANGTDGSNTITATGSWTVTSTQTARFTWSSANHVRYFFNAGGQIRISFSRTGGTVHTKNTEWTNLCTACSTLVFTARTLTKSGGSGTPTTLLNDGWYDISTTYVQKFKQFEGTSPYTANYIGVEFRTAASGTQLEIRVTYQDDATDTSIPASVDIVNGTLTTTFVERPPSTTNLTDSWGNPTFTTVTNTQT